MTHWIDRNLAEHKPLNLHTHRNTIRMSAETIKYLLHLKDIWTGQKKSILEHELIRLEKNEQFLD